MKQARRKRATKIVGPADVLVLDSTREPCPGCGGSFAWSLEAGNGGASFGDDYVHADECPKLRCAHGVLWENWGECKACEEDEHRREIGEDETGEES